MTYWVDPNEPCCSSSSGESQRGGVSVVKISSSPLRFGNRVESLIDWNTNVLARMLRSIVAFRDCRSESGHELKRSKSQRSLPVVRGLQRKKSNQKSLRALREGKCVLDEVKEIIDFPEIDPCDGVVAPDFIQLDPLVLSQLHDYVKTIAEMYNGCTHAFHNFEQ